MDGFSPEFQIDHSLRPGSVYKMTAPEIIQTSVWHYFIIVAVDDDDIYMVLCTTQIDNKIAFFDRRGIDHSTLVYIEPDSDKNGLEVDTYFDCNEKYQITENSLIEKLRDGRLVYKGQISLDQYFQIRQAIIDSYINDLPEFLLQHNIRMNK